MHVSVLVLVLVNTSLSMVILKSRDWSEIVWLLETSRFKNQTCNRLYSIKTIGMHWLGYYDAVSWLNKAKTRIFQPSANFENFKIYLYFVCLPASLPLNPVALGVGLQKFHMIKVMAADLRKYCSKDDLPSAP